jgi:nucleotide-binding universal stress UspA family protein
MPARCEPRRVQFKRILVACDFSGASIQALEYGLWLAREHDATVTLLHVIDALSERDALYAADQQTIAYIQQRKQHAREDLDKLVHRGMRAAALTCERVELGRPARTILRVASEIHADLIVMGTQSHGPLGVKLFGSATQTVLRAASCPVLTARAAAAIGD